MWIWDASSALDLAFYVMLMASTTQAGTPPVWVEVATPTIEQYDASAHIPALGECLIFDVQAEDWAGNRSLR